jgi:hypothetical protein
MEIALIESAGASHPSQLASFGQLSFAQLSFAQLANVRTLMSGEDQLEYK